MINKDILVISNKYDVHTDSVISFINQEKFNVIRINTEDFRANNISIQINNNNHIISIETPEKRVIDIDNIHTIYIRRISPLDLEDVQNDYKKFIQDEVNVVINFILEHIQPDKYIDKNTFRNNANNKISQLILAAKSGLSIPKTLVTNNYSDLIKFRDSKTIIYKTLEKPIVSFNEKKSGTINTSIITNKLFATIGGRLSTCPSLFQEYINKSFELRIHVIGNKIIAIKIDSQDLNEAKIDWRCANLDELTYSLYDLPKRINDAILRLMKGLKLHFGIIDMIVTPDKKHVFLEVNPNGNWLWIDKKLGNYPVSKAVARWLTN